MKSVTVILCVAFLSLSHASHACSLQDANWNLIPPITPDGEWRRLEVMEVSREKRAASLADVYPVVFSATAKYSIVNIRENEFAKDRGVFWVLATDKIWKGHVPEYTEYRRPPIIIPGHSCPGAEGIVEGQAYVFFATYNPGEPHLATHMFTKATESVLAALGEEQRYWLKGRTIESGLTEHVSLQARLLAISVSDLDRSVLWYTNILGFSESSRHEFADDGMRIAFLSMNGFELELIENSGSPTFSAPDPNDPATRQGLVKFAFHSDDIEQLNAMLIERGAAFVSTLRDSNRTGGRFMIIADPDGNWIQVFGPAQQADND